MVNAQTQKTPTSLVKITAMKEPSQFELLHDLVAPPEIQGSTSTRRLLGPSDWLLFFFAYLLLIECGILTLSMGGDSHVYWPASGLFVAALALSAKRRWALFIVASIVAQLIAFQFWKDKSLVECLVRIAANVAEAVIAASLLRRCFASPFNFKSLTRVIGFVALAGVLAPFAYASLMESAKFLWSSNSFGWQMLYLRWAGHAMGIITVGTVLISLATDLDWNPKLRRRALFFGVLALAVTAISIYAGIYPTRRFGLVEIQLPLIVLPVLVASAIFVNRPATLLIALFASVLAISFTIPASNRSDLLSPQALFRLSALHAYVLAATVWPLIVATVIDEKLNVSRAYSRQFEHLQQILQSSSDSITLKDSSGRYLLVNEAAAKLFLTDVETMIGKRNHDLLSNEVATQIERMEQMVKEGRVSETVEEHWNDRGQQRVFIISRCPWPRAGQGEKGLVVIAREVTEIRNQKLALLHSERRFQALVDSIPTCIFEADRFGQCRYVNAIWTELSGQTPEEAIDLGWVNAVHEHDRSEILRTWREFSAGEISEFVRELRLRKVDSSVTWVQIHIGPLHDEQKNVIGGIGAIIDITPRRYAEENLKESEELFRTLASAAPVMIWRTDANQRCSFLNDRWLDFLGMELAEAESAGWSLKIHPEDRARRAQVVAASFVTRTCFELDYRVLRRDGEYRWIVDSGVPIFDNTGVFQGFIGGCIDITERHAAQDAIQELNQELEARVQQRTAALTAANLQLQLEVEVRREILTRLEQKQSELAHVSRVTALGEMAAGLAHELKQPLHAIRNYVSGMKMLGKNSDPSSLATVALSEIDRETHRAAAIIDRIRSFAVRSTATYSPLYLVSVVEDSIALMQSEAARRGVRIELAPEMPRGLRVRGDWIQIQQVLVNLIQNAVDALENTTDREKIVRLRLQQESANVVIEVSDGGYGIFGDDHAKIFDAFFTQKPTGLGMGLAISRSIVEAHSGKIMVLKTGPQGTTMGVSLPIFFSEIATPQVSRTFENSEALSIRAT